MESVHARESTFQFPPARVFPSSCYWYKYSTLVFFTAILLPRSLSSRQRSRSSSPPPADYLSSNLSGTLQKGGRVSSRQRSLSSSPPPSIHHLSSALGGPLQRDEPIRKVHDRLQMENDLRRLRAKVKTEGLRVEPAKRSHIALKAYEWIVPSPNKYIINFLIAEKLAQQRPISIGVWRLDLLSQGSKAILDWKKESVPGLGKALCRLGLIPA